MTSVSLTYDTPVYLIRLITILRRILRTRLVRNHRFHTSYVHQLINVYNINYNCQEPISWLERLRT